VRAGLAAVGSVTLGAALGAAICLSPLAHRVFFPAVSAELPPIARFTGEVPRGAYAVPGGDADGCLVRIEGDSSSIWYYRVWRGEDPGNILTGHGPLVVHETPAPGAP
jgi:hypothetical protein